MAASDRVRMFFLKRWKVVLGLLIMWFCIIFGGARLFNQFPLKVEKSVEAKVTEMPEIAALNMRMDEITAEYLLLQSAHVKQSQRLSTMAQEMEWYQANRDATPVPVGEPHGHPGVHNDDKVIVALWTAIDDVKRRIKAIKGTDAKQVQDNSESIDALKRTVTEMLTGSPPVIVK